MKYQTIKNLKAQVKYILEKYPETRNSDIALLIEVWRNFYSGLIQNVSGTEIILLKSLYQLPREDNIKRARAYFQNDKGLFLPTDWQIAHRRGIAEDEWRVAMGYPVRRAIANDQPNFIPPSEQHKIGKMLPNNPLF